MIDQNGIDDLLSDINSNFNNFIEKGVDPLVQVSAHNTWYNILYCQDVQTVFPRGIGYSQQLIDHAFSAVSITVVIVYIILLLQLQNDVGNC